MAKKYSDFHEFLYRVKMYFITKIHIAKYGQVLNRLEQYRNKYKGKRCFIIGTGPSLTIEDLNRLKGEYTFASNSIFRYLDKTDWRPGFYTVTDHTWYDINRNDSDAIPVTILKMFPLDFGLKYGFNDNYCYYPRFLPIFSKCLRFMTNSPLGVQEGNTVTYFLMQLAAFMGFSEIYLLGIDFSYAFSLDKHGNVVRNKDVKQSYSFNDSNINKYPVADLNSQLISYKTARKYADSHSDFKIYNATRGGKLEVFQRVNIDEVLSERKK